MGPDRLLSIPVAYFRVDIRVWSKERDLGSRRAGLSQVFTPAPRILDPDRKIFQAALPQSYAVLINTGYAASDLNLIDDRLTGPQTIIVYSWL